MQNRRQFLKVVPALALIPLACPANARGEESRDKAENRSDAAEPYGSFDYRGFHVYWSGWIPCPDSTKRVGHWIAYPLSRFYDALESVGCPRESVPPFGIHASVPGGEGVYFKGETFDISVHEGQSLITLDTPEEIKYDEKRKGLLRLYILINKAWDEIAEVSSGKFTQTIFRYRPKVGDRRVITLSAR